MGQSHWFAVLGIGLAISCSKQANNGADGNPSDPDGASNLSDARTDAPVQASAGCGKPATSGYQCFDETFEGAPRRWCMFVPPGYDPNKPHSLMLGLHGCGGSPEGVHGNAAAPQETYAAADFVFVYPKSLGDCWEYNNPNSSDFHFVKHAIATASGQLCVDQARTFAHGMSSGGMMASKVLCQNIVKGSAAISLNEACSTQPRPVWLYGGTSDSYYDSYIAPGRDGWIRTNGCSATTQPIGTGPCVEYQGCRARTVWCSDARGHVWPREPWAAEGIMDFFRSL